MTSNRLDSTTVDQTQAVLAHYGIKGMHWGTRNGHSSKAAPSEDHTKAVAIRSKTKTGGGTHVLSNDELRTIIERLNLEQQHARLTGTDKSGSDKGRQFIKSIIGDVKTGVDAYETATKVSKIINEASKK